MPQNKETLSNCTMRRRENDKTYHYVLELVFVIFHLDKLLDRSTIAITICMNTQCFTGGRWNEVDSI